jgi:hypothetical protein
MTNPLRTLLKDYSFGDPLPDWGILPLFDFAEKWTGSQHEFEDAKLNAAVQAIWVQARDLSNLVAGHTYMIRGVTGQRSVKTDEDIRRGQRSAQTLAVTDEMNEKSTELLHAIEDFDRLMRKRLNVVG